MTIIFLGPLPPPTHGFSAINEAMLHKIKISSPEVFIFNRAQPNRAGKYFSYIKLLTKYIKVSISKNPKALYMGFSGGLGQIMDFPFILVANLLEINIYIHHHSFAYLNKKSIITQSCMIRLKKATHITLCPEMSQKISSIYKIPLKNCISLSNAAFIQPPDSNKSKNKTSEENITVGFLSNITTEKGIFEFFSSLEAAREKGLNFKAKIAGPVAKDIQQKFTDHLNKAPYISYIGPVYGKNKDDFFESIDLLLFPTKYINEAEPVTIHEALRAGARVIAAERGCIGGMLPDQCGKSVPIEEFQQKVIQTIDAMTKLSPQTRQEMREKIRIEFTAIAQNNSSILNNLINKICQ